MIKRIKHALKYSFIKRLMGLITLFNVILIVIFTVMTYFMTKVSTESDRQNQIRIASDYSKQIADDYLKSLSFTATSTAMDGRIANFLIKPSDRSYTTAALEALKSVSSTSGDNALVWCASELDGSLLTSAGEKGTINLSEYGWYDDFLTDVRGCRYYHGGNDPENGSNRILTVLPVESNENIIGYIGIEAGIESLRERICSELPIDSARMIVSDDYGNVICTSDTGVLNALMENSVYSIRDIAQISANRASSNVYSFKSGRYTNYYTVSQIANSDWKTIVVFDGKLLSGSFYTMFWHQIVILACLFTLELIATLNLIRHESKVIPQISSSISEISAGNYNFRINSHSENELGLIAESVDKLAQTLQDKNAVISDYVNLDPTTGLHNRYRMYEMINDLIISRDESRPRFALLFIDIDNFKWITETLGHRLGDEFLKIFGQRLKAVLPRTFRFSGDEYVSLVEDADIDSIDDLIHKLKLDFLNPIEILNDKLYATFSVGVAIYPDDDTNADMLLRDSDIAMSRSKEKGKDRLSYFNNHQHQAVLSKATIAQKLNKALDNGEMFLNFQPIITVSNGDIHGFEVLLRWESDELGYVSPANFVNIAEETGAIIAIGTWIFETACRYLKQMNEYNPDIIMSINVSPAQMKMKDFIEKIERVINITQVDPKNIQVEITEGMLIDFMDSKNTDILERLDEMGIALALDDFGTGYSSFSYLKSLPIKTLKVDKSFVDEICSKDKDKRITESIIDMVKNIGIKTVVEGVETIEQYNLLSDMQCDYIQGFLMSKPLSETDAMEFVIRYDELHKPNKQSLEKNAHMLALERLDREREKIKQLSEQHLGKDTKRSKDKTEDEAKPDDTKEETSGKPDESNVSDVTESTADNTSESSAENAADTVSEETADIPEEKKSEEESEAGNVDTDVSEDNEDNTETDEDNTEASEDKNK